MTAAEKRQARRILRAVSEAYRYQQREIMQALCRSRRSEARGVFAGLCPGTIASVMALTGLSYSAVWYWRERVAGQKGKPDPRFEQRVARVAQARAVIESGEAVKRKAK